MTRVLTWGLTEYEELWGGGYPQLHFASSSGAAQECTRQYLVDWDAQEQAVRDFLGYSTAIQVGGNSYYLSREIPHSHVDYTRPSDSEAYIYADDVAIEPFGIPVDANGQPMYGNESTISEEDTPVYNKAKLTVHYAAKMFRVLDDAEMPIGSNGYNYPDESSCQRYVEILDHPSGEYLSLPEGTFTFGPSPVDVTDTATSVPANKPALGTPGKIVNNHDLTILWRQVPRRMVASCVVMAPVLGSGTKQAAFDYALGRVNQSTFLGFPPETLLCDPMEITPWTQCDGEIVFDITFHFKYLQSGHNYFLTKNTANKLVSSQLTGNAANYTPGLQSDGQTVYDSYLFQYLFYGYDFSAGNAP